MENDASFLEMEGGGSVTSGYILPSRDKCRDYVQKELEGLSGWLVILVGQIAYRYAMALGTLAEWSEREEKPVCAELCRVLRLCAVREGLMTDEEKKRVIAAIQPLMLLQRPQKKEEVSSKLHPQVRLELEITISTLSS